ncbi:hypothetical protein M2324_003994 [Rhodovulum sulfidophilum]|uniref:hypothetical protein n=1 Tax=Rhodovulum sulfidophilum TaxID=35806 RepID=UPI0005A8A587|nr:hypothetical protein [Rhodovulum sulfidophilum]ANB35987.1 hypothetical protein A6W98_19065 [Rhodovulum sulfidophilum DSM 1374]ANB39790.1 hypothetical protein A6024_18825 [Rhodovulum sulfidophilum]MCW2305567.1 hypothetical protein [Rhodovulum sulfidophilum]
MKTILTTAVLALLAAPVLAATDTTEDQATAVSPASAPDCFAPIQGTNAFQRSNAPGCVYYTAPTGNDRDPAASGEGSGEGEGEGGESSDT